eukprot:933138-Prorocentrum_lima.AAC.1
MQKWKPATSNALGSSMSRIHKLGHVYTHQDHYVLELSEIDTKHLDVTHPEDDCDLEMHGR